MSSDIFSTQRRRCLFSLKGTLTSRLDLTIAVDMTLLEYRGEAARANAIPNIRRIEYNRDMQDAVRRLKAEIFQALAHPTRIAILEQLREGELGAGSLIERLGMEQANISSTWQCCAPSRS